MEQQLFPLALLANASGAESDPIVVAALRPDLGVLEAKAVPEFTVVLGRPV